MKMSKLIQNIEARDEIATRITSAYNGKRRSVGAAFRSHRAPWLARGERVVGIVGGKANCAVYSPAGARSPFEQDRILFFGAESVLSHEEIADETAKAWFEAAFSRAA
jgi:hypothetical protein